MPTKAKLPPSGFGSVLRRLREGKGLTQKQLGDAAEIHSNTIAKLERGVMEPSWQLVLKLATVLGVECTAFNVTPAASSSQEQPAADKPAPAPPGPGGIKAPLAAVSPPAQQPAPKKGKK
jgi:transcriptional regulator with XRE-family HTH domain